MLANILGFLKIFCNNRKKIIFCTITSLYFIDIAMFPNEFFNTKIILNY